MCKKYNINLIITILLSMLLYTNNVAATKCYEKSPNLISLKDKYYNLETIKILTAEEKTKLNTLFDKIEGEWKGDLIHIECKGPDSAPRRRSKTASIESIIKLKSNNNVTFSANKSYTNNVTRNEILTLLGDLRIFELEFLNMNSIVFSERGRKKNVTKGSRLTETIYKITLNHDSLIFVRSYYSYGVFVAEEKWSMN